MKRLFRHMFIPRIDSKLKFFFKILLYVLGFVLLLSGLWLRRNFGIIDFDQFLFSAMSDSESLLTSAPTVVRSAIINIALVPIILLLAIGVTENFFIEKMPLHANPKTLANERNTQGNIVFKWLPLVVFLGGMLTFLSTISFWKMLANSFSTENYFGNHYVHADVEPLEQTKKRNLILIYVESLENTYGDEKLFGRNLLKALQPEQFTGVSFRFLQQSSAGYTIGAQIATQCGAPIKVFMPNLWKKSQHADKRAIMPSARCLGDVLQENGYRNFFVQGVSLAFSGQGTFWSGHGYQQTFGSKELESLGYEKGHEWWGIPDDKVLEFSKKTVDTLEAEKTPYGLAIALVDTHPPKGFVSERCKASNAKGMDDIFECTATMVAEFIHSLRSKGYLENTNIVVIGDHLTMAGSALEEKLSHAKDRTIFNLFISKEPYTKTMEEITHFDLFPTILDFMGFKVKDGRAGLGYSGFGPTNPGSAKKRIEEMNKSLMGSSKEYLTLWAQ